MLKEFKDFMMKGNVLEFAVAVIMAGAFGAIITALVNDIILPPIGLLLGGQNFSELIIPLSDAAEGLSRTQAIEAGAPYIGWGIFMQMIINFMIIGFVMFMLVRAYNSANPPEEEEAGPSDVDLLTEIRDLLKNQS